jgi:formate-dependent nitrite reductase membrane component NrfD
MSGVCCWDACDGCGAIEVALTVDQINDARTRSVLSIIAVVFAILHTVARLSRPANNVVTQRTYGSFMSALIAHAAIRIGTMSVAPSLYVEVVLSSSDNTTTLTLFAVVGCRCCCRCVGDRCADS